MLPAPSSLHRCALSLLHNLCNATLLAQLSATTRYRLYHLKAQHSKLTTVKMRSKFKDEHPFEKRKAEAERIRQKYNDHIPVCLPAASLCKKNVQLTAIGHL